MWSYCRPNVCAVKKMFESARKLHLHVGQKAEMTKCFTRDEVKTFATITNDTNPIHLDEDYAQKTRFAQCIVHGVMVNGLISALLGTVMPGEGSVLLSQETQYLKPLYIGETVTAIAEIISIRKRIVTCSTKCIIPDSNKVLMQGSVQLLVPREKLQTPKYPDT